MPKTTSWTDIRTRRPPNEQAVELEKLKLGLAMLREQVGASQAELAQKLGTSQSNVSQLERSNQQLLSSVARYVHALGGELKLTAVVGGTTYTLLDDVGDPEPRSQKSLGSARVVRSGTVRGQVKTRTPPGRTKAAVLGALAEGVPMTAREVATSTGLNRSSVSKALTKLTRSGEAVRASRGYSLASKTTTRKIRESGQ